MQIGSAIEILQEGYAVQRNGWGEEYIELNEPDEEDGITDSYFLLTTNDGLVVYTLTTDDVLAHDWQIIELETESE